MQVQLLLLLALAGPFCGFTHASPTALPADLDVAASAAPGTEASPEAPDVLKEEVVVTGPPPAEPETAPGEVATETLAVEVPATTYAPAADPAVVTEAPVAATEAPVVEHAATEAPAAETAETPAAATAPVVPDVPDVPDVPATSEKAEVEVNEAVEAETDGQVVVENGAEDGLSSGQVVGIVIGALVAVIIVIAVVIALVRRMGKYSP